jgi:hypothetical protein
MPELGAVRGKRDLAFQRRQSMGAQNLEESHSQTVAVPAASMVAAHPSMVRADRAYPWRARDPPPGTGVGEEDVIAQISHVKQK